jgi:hypothetical protein
MKKQSVILFVVCVFFVMSVFSGCSKKIAPTSPADFTTKTVTATVVIVPVFTESATKTSTKNATFTVTTTITKTYTLTQTLTMLANSATYTPTLFATGTQTHTQTSTTIINSATYTPTLSATGTQTHTRTSTTIINSATYTPTLSATGTQTHTQTSTTIINSATYTPTLSATGTQTQTRTFTAVNSVTLTLTLSATGTSTPTRSHTAVNNTATQTRTVSVTMTFTHTGTATIDLSSPTSTPTATTIVVVFGDPNLEAEIRTIIGRPTGNIFPADMAALTSLNLSGHSISNLTGLEYCINLNTLNLSNNSLSGSTCLAPIGALPELVTLNISNNTLTSLDELDGIYTVLYLYASANPTLSDVSTLKDFGPYNVIDLSDCGLTSINISFTTTLAFSKLYLSGNVGITDLNLLSNNTNIGGGAELYIYDIPLSPLALSSISHLEVAHGAIIYTNMMPTPTASPTIIPTGSWAIYGTASFSTGAPTNSCMGFIGSNPVVAYLDSGDNLINAYRHNGTDWAQFGAADFSVTAAKWLDMAVDGTTVYVSYADQGTAQGKCTVMRKVNLGAWNLYGTAGFTPSAVSCTSIAVDSGVPYVCFIDTAVSGKLTVMKKTSALSAWAAVGSAGFTAEAASTAANPRIAIDSATGYLYTAFLDNAGTNVIVYSYKGSVWSNIGTVCTNGANSISLIVVNSAVYAAYQDNGSDYYVKKYEGGTSWSLLGGMAVANTSNSYKIILSVYNSEIYAAFGTASSGSAFNLEKFNGVTWQPVGGYGIYNVDFYSGIRSEFTSGVCPADGTPYVAGLDMFLSPHTMTALKYTED